MEGLMVSVATGALKAVSVKLATLLGGEFKHMKDVHKEIEPLSKELDWMHAFLEKMSGEESPDEHDKIWMREVREMSYDIEDTLDDLMVCSGDEKSVKPKGLTKKCKKLLDRIKTHRRVSKAIKDLKTQIEVVGDRNQRYRTCEMSEMRTYREASGMIDGRALVIFNEASELVGIDGSKHEVISMLAKDESSSQHQVKLVSVVGCGGLGKTTLAKQVYDSIQDKFDCGAFITVSRNPDMMKLLRTLLSDVSSQGYTDTEAGDVQHLVEKISNFLRDKRYFIVVDDIWHPQSWETIKCAFIKNSCGSRIITTTRINEVAESCLSSYQGHIYPLPPLDPINSRRLFLKRIFGLEEGCPLHLIKVCDDILKKCGGLPLAIISIAGLLASKAPTLDEWRRVQSSFGYALERQSHVNKMMQILSLSYYDLPPHLRSCLVYLSVFPEDYKIDKDELIMRWIAEGFINEKHGFTQYELGEMYFNDLINRSLIEPYGYSWPDRLSSCRVHDIILEFIVSKAVEDNFVTLFGIPSTIYEPGRKIRRLSVMDTNEPNDDLVGLREKMVYSHARTFTLFSGNLDSILSLQKFRHVRVLDLGNYKGLQTHHLAHLGKLFALKYLCLSRTNIQKLPKEIGELQHLQTLDIKYTRIKELPSSVVRLARLVCLLCDSGVRVPDGFGNMQALQILAVITLSSQSPTFIQELCRLRNLRMLEIDVEKNEATKDLVSSLSTLGAGSLNSLILGLRSAKLMEEPWWPTPLSLKLFAIRCGMILCRVPRWIGLLYNLQQLALNVRQLGSAEVCLLGRLNALFCLSLRVDIEVADRSPSYNEAQRVKISGAHGFPRLTTFKVGSHNCAFGLLFEVGAMPKLQKLELEFDRDKTGCLTNGEFDFGIQHLPRLAMVIFNFGNGWEIDGGDTEDWEPADHPAWNAIEAAISSNPNHPRLCLGTISVLFG